MEEQVKGQAEAQQSAPVETQQVATPEAAGQVAQVAQEVDASQIPEKFVGKSPLEIVRAYQESEKAISRLGSEKAARERELEATRARLAALEQQISYVQQSQPTAPTRHEESDPLSVFEEVWDQNPKEAIKKGLEGLKQQVSQNLSVLQQESRSKLTAERYNKLKSENPDFAELEPEMVRIANQYRGYIRPEALNSPETIDLIYGLAKAQNMQKYVQVELERARKSGSVVREQKQGAFSESAAQQSGDSSKTRDFASLSLAEMRALLGIADK